MSHVLIIMGICTLVMAGAHPSCSAPSAHSQLQPLSLLRRSKAEVVPEDSAAPALPL